MMMVGRRTTAISGSSGQGDIRVASDRSRVAEHVVVRHRQAGTVELVHKCQAGEDAAWRELVAIFAPVVRTVARSTGLRHAECEDACQLTWLRVVENLSSLREP